jgi:hypothetical protein
MVCLPGVIGSFGFTANPTGAGGFPHQFGSLAIVAAVVRSWSAVSLTRAVCYGLTGQATGPWPEAPTIQAGLRHTHTIQSPQASQTP